MSKRKQYFVILGAFDIRHNINWTKTSVKQWGKEMAEQGNKVRVFEGNLIDGYDINFKIKKIGTSKP